MDERLRELERKAKQGDPAAEIELAKARIRAGRVENLWEHFDLFFDLVEQRPWDTEKVQLLTALCQQLPTTDPSHIQNDQERVVIDAPADFHDDNTPARLKRLVIRGGRFDGVLQFRWCERVVILGGKFSTDAFPDSKHVIVLGGQFRDGFDHTTHLTIINGLFTDAVHAGSHGLIIGGTFNGDVRGDTLTILGGTFPQYRFSATLEPEARIWLPETELRWPAIPCDAQVAALMIETIGVDNVWRQADTSFHSGMGRTRTPRTRFYVRLCPQKNDVSADLHDIIWTSKLGRIMPTLRSDTRINRDNLSAFLDAQFERLRQTGEPCFPPSQAT